MRLSIKLDDQGLTLRASFFFRDILILSEDGYGVVTGRIKDIIIRGGENIQPQDIEYFLESHPEIIQAQVCHDEIDLSIQNVQWMGTAK